MFSRKNQNRLIKKFIKKLTAINQPITVTDLLVSPLGNSLGEVSYTHKDTTKISPVTRMAEQIKIFAQIANQYHQERNLMKSDSGQYAFKPNCMNKITRLTTYEFAFYTKEPLEFDQFNQLIESIEAIARDCHENLFLVLSSIAVKKNKNLFNMVVHVECGKTPVIQITTKAYPSSIDPEYNKYKRFFKNDDNKNPSFSMSLLGKSSSPAIPYNPIIISKVAGGAEIVTMIDICLDHTLGYAIHMLEGILKASKRQLNVGLFPSQVSYILTSNSLDHIKKSHLQGSIITRVDPDNELLGIYNVNDDKYLQEDKMKNSDLMLDSGSNNKIKFNSGCTLVLKPSFGDVGYKITAFPERSAENFDKKFISKVNKLNKEIVVNSVKQTIGMKSTKGIEKQYTKEKRKINSSKASLFKPSILGKRKLDAYQQHSASLDVNTPHPPKKHETSSIS